MPPKERTLYFLGLLLALGLLVPDHFLPWPAFRHDVLVGIAFLPFICQSIFKQIKIPKEGVFLLIFSAIPLLQMITGKIVFSGDGWISWLYLSAAALTLIAAFNLINRSSSRNPLEELSPVIAAVLSAAVASVGILLIQWLNLEILPELAASLPSSARPSANLAQPNQLATILLIGLACTSFFFENKKLNSCSAFCLSMLLLFGLALTQSRAVFLALIFICVMYVGLRKRAKLRMRQEAVLVLAAFFTTTILLLPWLNELLLLKNAASLATRTSKDVRVDLWLSMIDAVTRAPWSGYGWGQISMAQQAVALDHPATYGFFDSAHNIFLDIALWAGLPVAAIAAVFLIFWFKRQITACRDALSWSILLAVGVVFCHAMVEYPLAYAYILLPTCLFMGALSKTGADFSRKRIDGGALSSSIFVAVSAATLTIFFAISTEYIRFENGWRALRLAAADIGPKGEGSTGFKPLLLTQLREYAEFYQIEPKRGMSEEEVFRMSQIARRFGQQSVLTRYAVAAALNGRPEESAKSLAVLCKTQWPRVCNQAIDRWRAIARDPAYPEFRQVALPLFSENR